jgi:hypothetical protein
MKKGETRLIIINLGFPKMLWPSLDEYITFPSEKLLPKFDPKTSGFLEDHIKKNHTSH